MDGQDGEGWSSSDEEDIIIRRVTPKTWPDQPNIGPGSKAVIISPQEGRIIGLQG